MERIMCITSFVNTKNRLLFRWPIYNKCVSGERKINTMETRLKVMRPTLLVNHINCRYKSSRTTGNIHMLQVKPSATREKRPKARSLQTDIARVNTSSSSQTQRSVKLVTKGNLPHFVNDSMQSTKLNQDTEISRLNEEPLLFIPGRTILKNNPELFESLKQSFENFLRMNPQHEVIVKIPKKSDQKLPKSDTELQKDFDSMNPEDLKNYQKSMNQSLKCYINACISSDLTDRAYAVLMSIRSANPKNKKSFKLNNPELYIDVMSAYTNAKNWTKVNDIYNILIGERISITPQVYVSIFDCLARMPNSEQNTSLIRTFIGKAQEQSISLNDIMDKSTFIKDQRIFVLGAIRRIQPDFTPVYTPPQLAYSNKLVESLNENIHSIDQTPSEILKLKTEYSISKPRHDFTETEVNERIAEQIKNESDGYVRVKSVTMLDSSKCMTEKVSHHRQLLEKLENQWRIDIPNAIKRRLNILQQKMRSKPMKFMNVYPYLCLLKPEQYTEILIDELNSLAQDCELYSPTVIQIYGDLGRRVMHKYHLKLKEQNGVNEKIRHLYKTYREMLCSGACPDNPRQLWQRLIHHSRANGPCALQENLIWPWNVQCELGRTLFKILMDVIKIDGNLIDAKSKTTNYVPIVYSIFRKRDYMSREEIRPHPTFVKLVHETKQDTMKFKANEVPMLCPPIAWTSPEYGGYLHSHTDLLRLPPSFTVQNDLVRQVPPEQLYPTLDSLNQLGSIPWRVNKRILDLAIEIFNNGGDERLDVPLTPDSMLTDTHLRYRGITRGQLQKMIHIKDDKYQQRQNELLSMYSDTLYKLSLANHFRDRTFWLPTNLDFRGRSYPVPPHLTHLSADLTRSMLCFHQKQPLGESGLDWLKLHCINLTGTKKRDSLANRLAYANEIIDDILDSADNPLNGRQWWLKSDDPWQTLAACIEIADAMRSPNPAEYMSGFPVHQDGSCNGLQHYAALGRDVEGAASVNLAPSEFPQDVYSTVADRVEEQRKKDAANGLQLAIHLEGIIKRKIVKQTVMTTVYGVTAYGARLQIKKQLENIDFPSELLGAASTYLTKKTIDSISEMFSSAREIQDWLTDAAEFIASTERSKHVEWTTPLGLPIIQPYTRPKKFKSDVKITTIDTGKQPLNRIKEKNAFSPNFIHSLDSCHMMLTSLNCEMNGVTFVSVHDCFWTHPSTVPIMNRICREQFILLHSQPILEDLGQSFYHKYETEYLAKLHPAKTEKKRTINNKKKRINSEAFMNLPEKGEFDLNSVLNSKYFFS